ncbi:MAG: D-glycero-beta-D-manno-heptose-7-phosphate kinase [Candidatus Zixiibacteriota bacterium]|jgi:D-beta-D-heptose 7-phosphate kinase/D-beta-D-heptose 1-phosphate adenosyltransferase
MAEPKELLELLERASATRLLIVGDVMLDHYVFGDAARLSPEAPVPVVRVERDVVRPGGAANTAVNVRALGAEVELASVAGDDDNGRSLRLLLEEEGVYLGGLVVAADRPTTWKGRVIARQQQLVRLDREDDGDLDEKLEAELLGRVAEALPRVGGVILSDYGKGAVTARVAAEVIARAAEAGKIICVDPKTNHFRLYRGVTSMTPNHHEATAAAGIRQADDPTLERTGRALLEMLESASVLITWGERGMVLFGADGTIDRIPTRAREVYDVAGAGDTVIATFAAALAAGGSHLASAQLANFAASVVVAKVGTATATPEEIGQAINGYYKDDLK